MYKGGKEIPVTNKNSFFTISDQKGKHGEALLALNADIWNNAVVVSVAGYTIEELI